LAQENGIRRADSIIEKVVNAISSFKELAQKNGVSTEWIQRINLCLNSHLKDWGFYRSQNLQREFNLNGHHISSVEIEQAYKGNLILRAIIDGRKSKHVIRRATQDFEKILSKGFVEPSDDFLIDMINNYFLSES
ncbi:MAG: type II toxin-antitoxin system HipA family toxin, partial [Prevotella sp.]|nr:type II toxin-antitoxin system HipA family toxin [Prevotella sp.]